MSKPYRPDLRFNSYDQLLTDAKDLHTTGWEKAGQWSLAMICDHIVRWIDGMLGESLPHIPGPFQWIARFVIRRMVQKQSYPMIPFHAPTALKPAAEISESTALENLAAAITRLNELKGPTVQTHPFGPIVADDFRGMTLLHAAHHLSFVRARISE